MPQRRKSNEEHRLNGTYRPDRHAGQPPAFAAGIPDPPDFLTEEGVRYFEQLAGLLDRAGMMTEADAVALGLLVDSLIDYRNAKQQLAEHGPIAYGKSGAPYLSPHAVWTIKTRGEARAALAAFGLTPVSRQRLVIQGSEDEPSIAALLDDMTLWEDD